MDHDKLWEILKEMGIPDHSTCLLRNLYACQEASMVQGFPGTSAGKESTCKAGLIPGSGISAGEGIGYPFQYSWASLVVQMGKNLSAMWETWVRSLGWEDPLKKGTATHSNILASKVPCTEELTGYSPWGCKELDTTEWLSLSCQEATVRTRHGKTNWFKIGKGVHQGCILSPCLFNLHAEYIMWNARLDESQARTKIAGRNISHLRYADDTTLMAESEEELKSLLMKVKGEWKSWLTTQY